MRIGIGKKSESGLRFDVDIPGLAPFAIDLERNPTPSDRQPDWHAYYAGQRCGAFWKKVPRDGGEAFLSGNLEHPLVPGGRLEVTIFTAKESGSQKDMVWRPERSSGGSAAASTSSSTGAAPERTPPPVARGGEDDDDIPF
jgi:uncharacterized protein (DUF736 family)